MDKFLSKVPRKTDQSTTSEPTPATSASSKNTPEDLKWDSISQPQPRTLPKDKNNRCFRVHWYQKFLWLEYSVQRDAAFCFPCRRFLSQVTKEKAFTSIGYRNWKAALGDKKKGFCQHESTAAHISAMVMWSEYKKRCELGQSVSTLVNDKQLERNRYYVSSVVQVVQFIISNELAVRGSWDKVCCETGLFMNLFNYTLKMDKKLADIYNTIPANAKYTSWKIQNEVIDMMSEMVANSVATDVKTADVPW